MPQTADLPAANDYRELDVVETRAAIWAEDHLYPSGSQGTIVYVHKGGQAFEVEFASPAAVVVTLEASDLGPVRWRA
jgi:hypothetical protein